MTIRHMPALAMLAESTARRHDTTVDAIVSRSRQRNVVEARHELWALLRERGLSYPAIARITCGDHTSVMYGCVRHARRVAKPDAIPDLVVA